MAAAVKIREDYSAEALRQLAVKAKDANQARRLLALAAVREGNKREEAARIGGMDRRTLRDWVHAFNQRGHEGLINEGCRRPSGHGERPQHRQERSERRGWSGSEPFASR